MTRMYLTMQRLQSAKRSRDTFAGMSGNQRAAQMARPESLLAAVISQMHRRDTLVLCGDDPLAKVAVCEYFPVDVSSLHRLSCSGAAEECAAFAAGIAMRSVESMRGGGARPVTVAILQDLPPMRGVLDMIQKHSLPLILVAEAEADTRADAQRRVLMTKVPILPVDRADAVAVCRVMQESMRRARMGLGGAVLHAVPMPGSLNAMEAMAQHMRARGLPASA